MHLDALEFFNILTYSYRFIKEAFITGPSSMRTSVPRHVSPSNWSDSAEHVPVVDTVVVVVVVEAVVVVLLFSILISSPIQKSPTFCNVSAVQSGPLFCCAWHNRNQKIKKK